jgi:hypothetical protein
VPKFELYKHNDVLKFELILTYTETAMDN